MTHIHTDTTHMDIGYDEHMAYLLSIPALPILTLSGAWDISDILIDMKRGGEVYARNEYRAARKHIDAFISECKAEEERARDEYIATPYNDVVHNVQMAMAQGV